MYAVFADGGKQYYAEEGQRVLVDLREVEVGKTIEFDKVLIVGGGEGGTTVGRPTVAGAKIIAEVIDDIVAMEKIHIRTYKRRKNFRRHIGHRQKMVAVKITQIVRG